MNMRLSTLGGVRSALSARGVTVRTADAARRLIAIGVTLLALTCAATIAWPVNADAQTRADEHAKRQSQKAAAVRPPAPNRAERIVARLQASPILGGAGTGLYPVVRTIYPGGWLALGAGYRRPFADTGSVTLGGAWSVRNFKTIEALVTVSGTRWRQADVRGGGQLDRRALGRLLRDRQRLPPDDKVAFGYEPRTVGATVRVRPHRFVTFGAGVDHMDIRTYRGVRFASIETLFDSSTAPGSARVRPTSGRAGSPSSTGGSSRATAAAAACTVSPSSSTPIEATRTSNSEASRARWFSSSRSSVRTG